MAETKFKIVFEADANGALTNVGKVESQLANTAKGVVNLKTQLRDLQKQLASTDAGSKEFEALSKQAGQLKDKINDASEAVRANAGSAFESLSNNAVLLKDRLFNLDFEGVTQSFRSLAGSVGSIKFSDITAGIQSMGKSFAALGKALLANPIFLVGAALAALVLNFDSIKEAIDLGVEPSTRRLTEATSQLAEASDQALKSFDLEEKRLRALGATEDEIAEKRRAATKERRNALLLDAIAQKAILDQQINAVAKARAELASTNPALATKGAASLAFLPGEDEIKEGLANIEALKQQIIAADVAITEIDRKTIDRKKAENKEIAVDNLKTQQENARNAEAAAAEQLKIAQDFAKSQEEIFVKAQQIRKEIEKDSAIPADRLSALRTGEEAQFKILEDQAKLRLDLLEDTQAKEIEAIDQKYIRERELAHGNAELLKQLSIANAQEVTEVEAKYNKQRADAEKQVQASKVQLVQDGLSALIELNSAFAGKTLQEQKRAFNINKSLQVAQIGIETYKGAQSAFNSLASIPYVGPVLGGIAAAAAVVAGIARAKKVLSMQFNEGGATLPSSEGGGSGVSFSSANTQAPTFNPVDNTFLQNRPPQTPPVQAYVLAGDVASQGEARQKIDQRARL